jgi:hypothetical protein
MKELKLKDLKIGNNVYDKRLNIMEVFKLEKIDNGVYGIKENIKAGCINIPDCDVVYGIPLYTTEILKKVGCIETETCWVYKELAFSKKIFEEHKIQVWKKDSSIGYIKLEFFHEFQNLAYSLFGYDLKLLK